MNGTASYTMRSEDESPGLAAANRVVQDQATAYNSLGQARNALEKAVTASDSAMDKLRDLIVKMRPTGVLTVDEMSAAIGRPDRNYIDSVWSAFGTTTTGKQTRVAVSSASEADKAAATAALAAANKAQLKAADDVKTARAERDRIVAMVYASRILGPSAIADAVYVDRNHVLRIARKAGVAPAHRPASRNQYSDGAPAKPKKRARKRPAPAAPVAE